MKQPLSFPSSQQSSLSFSPGLGHPTSPQPPFWKNSAGRKQSFAKSRTGQKKAIEAAKTALELKNDKMLKER